MSNPYTETLANQVKAAIYNHFLNHTGETITSEEWNAAAVAIILELQGTTPTAEILLLLDQAEARAADQELFYQEEVRKATIKGKESGINQSVVSLQSFVDSEPRLGPDDKKDVPGVIRAIGILRKELL